MQHNCNHGHFENNYENLQDDVGNGEDINVSPLSKGNTMLMVLIMTIFMMIMIILMMIMIMMMMMMMMMLMMMMPMAMVKTLMHLSRPKATTKSVTAYK